MALPDIVRSFDRSNSIDSSGNYTTDTHNRNNITAEANGPIENE